MAHYRARRYLGNCLSCLARIKARIDYSIPPVGQGTPKARAKPSKRPPLPSMEAALGVLMHNKTCSLTWRSLWIDAEIEFSSRKIHQPPGRRVVGGSVLNSPK